MSDNSDFNFDFEPDDFDESAYWQEPDFLLSNLVASLINVIGVEIGITLVVKGTIITGTLVSEHAYLAAITELFTRQARQSINSQDKDTVKEIEEAFDFTSFAESIYPPEKKEESGDEPSPEDLALPPVRHLHLKDPVIISPQPAVSFMNTEVPIVRLRLNAVDGWLLGRAAPAFPYSDDLDDSSNTILH